MSLNRKQSKGLAKSAVMQPEYRPRVVENKAKYGKKDRKHNKQALKKGLYFIYKKVMA